MEIERKKSYLLIFSGARVSVEGLTWVISKPTKDFDTKLYEIIDECINKGWYDVRIYEPSRLVHYPDHAGELKGRIEHMVYDRFYKYGGAMASDRSEDYFGLEEYIKMGKPQKIHEERHTILKPQYIEADQPNIL